MPLSIPAVMERLARMDIELLTDFMDSVQREHRRTIADLERDFDDLPEQFVSTRDYEAYLDMASDHVEISRLTRNLGAELAVVALYRVVEIRTKRILAWRYGTGKAKRVTAKDIAKMLKKDGIIIEEVPWFSTIDELRRRNNKIKHEAELGHGLNEDESSLESEFERFCQAVPPYLRDLADQVIPSVDRNENG